MKLTIENAFVMAIYAHKYTLMGDIPSIAKLIINNAPKLKSQLAQNKEIAFEILTFDTSVEISDYFVPKPKIPYLQVPHDIILNVTDCYNVTKEFEVNRAILSAQSAFFRATFAQNKDNTRLEHKADLPLSAFNSIITYMYTEELAATPCDCLFILALHDFYQFEEESYLQYTCTELIKNSSEKELAAIRDKMMNDGNDFIDRVLMIEDIADLFPPSLVEEISILTGFTMLNE